MANNSISDTCIKVWSVPVRLMHWGLVAAFCTAWYWRTSQLEIMNHIYAGFAAMAIITLRSVYGVFIRDFSGFHRFPPNPPAAGAYLLDLFKGRAKRYIGHNPAGALAIYAILTLGFLTTLTGYMGFEQIEIFTDYETMQGYHAFIAKTWLGMIALHISGVIVGSVMHRENLILSMITGTKRRRLKHKSVENLALTVSQCDFEIAEPVKETEISETMRLQYVQEAAYYLAERRGFQEGYAWQDWITAEKQVDEMLKENKMVVLSGVTD